MMLADNRSLLQAIKNAGHSVEILPEMHIMNPLRSKVLPGAKGVKNPDFRIDGQYVEIKRVRSGKIAQLKKG